MSPGDEAARMSNRKGNGSGGAGAPSTSASLDESPGVPGFRTWRGVYWFVFGFFVAAVIGLTIFSRVFA